MGKKSKRIRNPGTRWRVLARYKGGDVSADVRDAGNFDEIVDEVVVDDWLHVEQMTDRTWFMSIGNGAEYRKIWVTVRRDGSTRIRLYEGADLLLHPPGRVVARE